MKQALPPLCLITRPAREGAQLARRLEVELGMESLLAPVLSIEPLPVHLDFSTYKGVILTSVQASRRLSELDVPRDLPCFAVGLRSCAEAVQAGYDAQALGGDAEALIAALLVARPASPLVHLRGKVSRGDIARRLSDAGIACSEAFCYQQVKLDLSEEAHARLSDGWPVILPLFSPRSAAILRESGADLSNAHLVCMSPAVGVEMAHTAALSCDISTAPTENAMIEAIARRAFTRPSLEGGRAPG